MPYYTVQHLTPLTSAQKDAIAEAITRIHTTQFDVLRNFINVRFFPLSPETELYIGGIKRPDNHILATVRVGPSRTKGDWDNLCLAIQDTWKEIVIDPASKGKKLSKKEREELELPKVLLVGSPTTGMELGELMPLAGGDAGWLEQNWERYVAMAERGEGMWAENVKDARERGLVDLSKVGKK